MEKGGRGLIFEAGWEKKENVQLAGSARTHRLGRVLLGGKEGAARHASNDGVMHRSARFYFLFSERPGWAFFQAWMLKALQTERFKKFCSRLGRAALRRGRVQELQKAARTEPGPPGLRLHFFLNCSKIVNFRCF
jgi:hypothetical protein